MSLCGCPLASLFFFSFLAFLWVFNSSLWALPIIYDILLLVRSSWKTCSYGNGCFQTGWFQLQNNIIKYATAHISFNGKCILMICTTKSETLSTFKNKTNRVESHLIESETRWLSEESFWELLWAYLGKLGERSTGFEIMVSRDLWPLRTGFNRGGLNWVLAFLFLVHSLILNPDGNLFVQSIVTGDTAPNTTFYNQSIY